MVNVKVKGEEIRRRLSRIVMSLVTAVIFWIVVRVVMAIFLIRMLSDALVLGDILTDVVVSRGKLS